MTDSLLVPPASRRQGNPQCYNEVEYLPEKRALSFLPAMIQRLQAQLITLFTAFVLLAVVSVSVTYWGLQTQQQDALLISLAGRQHMLAQQMTGLALQLQSGNGVTRLALQESEQIFTQTLSALRNGGTVPSLTDSYVTLQPAHDPQLLAALGEEQAVWDRFHSTLNAMPDSVADPSLGNNLQTTLEQESGDLAQSADAVVRLYQSSSLANVNRLRIIQAIFLLCALGLLALGAWILHRSLLKPLRRLGSAATRLGENDLDTPVQVEGPTEIQRLSQSFDTMRSHLRSARQELLQWNATLEQRVTQRTQALEALNEVSLEISSRLDIQQVLASVTEKTRSLLDADVVALCLLDESRHWLKLQAMSGPDEAVVERVTPANLSPTEAILKGDQAFDCGTGLCRGGCAILSGTYRASHLAAPLKIEDRVIGALCVGSTVGEHFTCESAELLTKLANTAAIALENAHLFAQAERVATLEERRRVAAEMHDGLGQTLSYLGLVTDQVVNLLSNGQEEAALERLHRTREAIGKATGEVRRALNNLMDESPLTIDLCLRLRAALDEIAAAHGLKAVWLSETETAPQCSPQVAEQVYDITHEALNNVAHHAQAHQVSVHVGRGDGYYFVTVEDDGRGFEPSRPAPEGHFGLQIMQARAAHIGGKVRIKSVPAGGTRVTLVWPMSTGD